MTRRRVTAIAAAALFVSSCSLEQAYRQDARVEILSPQAMARVDLPVKIRWSVDDFHVMEPGWASETSPASGAPDEVGGVSTSDGGYFAVFVDRTPVPPGVELISIAGGDAECEATPSCPDQQYFADEGIHLTSRTELTVESLPDLRRHESAKDWHEVTIVFVEDNKAGTGEIGEARRLGTAAFSVRFVVDRPR